MTLTQLFPPSHTLMLVRQMYPFTSDNKSSDFRMVRYVLSQEYMVLEMEMGKNIFTENICTEIERYFY